MALEQLLDVNPVINPAALDVERVDLGSLFGLLLGTRLVDEPSSVKLTISARVVEGLYSTFSTASASLLRWPAKP